MQRELAHARLKVRRALAPATAEEIARSLDYLAKAFGATVPDKDGIKMYVLALQAIGAEPLKQGFRSVLMTHRFPTLPLPAEILAAGMERHRILKLFERRLDVALHRLSNAT